MAEIGSLERQLINGFQGGFPIVEQPFAQVAGQVGSDEAAVIAAVSNLLEQGWLTRFGPLYNAERMGGGLALAAMTVPEREFQRVTGILNEISEVAHNYKRDHWLNMWFVLATESPESLQQAVADIESGSGLSVYVFPKEREFYLGLWLQLGEDRSLTTRSIPGEWLPGAVELSQRDLTIVAATQSGLPLTEMPYADIAEKIGYETVEVMERLEQMLNKGVIRRIGLVPNHFKLGFRGNGMTVWDIPDEHLENLGMQIGALDFVSHCYARPRRLPDWPYNLFAMVHGRDRGEVLKQVEHMEALLKDQCRANEVLFSSAILKKTGMRLPG